MAQRITKLNRRPDRDWQHSSGGTMFVFEITTTDGLHGFVNAKSESPWFAAHGTDVIVTLKNNFSGENMLKIDKPEFEGARPAMQPNTAFLSQSTMNSNRRETASIIASWAIDHAMKLGHTGIPALRETAKELMELQHELKVHFNEKYP